MIFYMIKRIAWMFVVLFIIISFLYISTRFATTFQYQRRLPFSEVLGVAISNYKDYIIGIVTRWDWGETRRGMDAWDLMVSKLPISLKINLISFFVYVPVGILLGIIAAVKKNKVADHSIAVFTLVFSSIPNFVLAFGLILVIGYRLWWVPPMYPVIAYSLKQRILGYVIPVLSLSLGPIAYFARMMRGELLETFESDFLLLARSKGLNQRQVIFRHALRNSAVVIMPALSTTFIVVLTGSFLVEVIYNIQGIANLYMDSLLRPFMSANYVSIDTNLVAVVTFFYASLGIVMSLVIDMLYVLVDPRIKIGRKKVSN